MGCEKHGYENPTFCPMCDVETIAADEGRVLQTPEDKARLAFFAEHNEEPVRTTACRVALKYEIDTTHPIVDDIQRVIEDAYDLGKKYGARFGSN